MFDVEEYSPGNGFDVAPDGRILMLRVASDVNAEEDSRRIHIVLNFFEELKRRVPPD